jgi:hypothetical protein
MDTFYTIKKVPLATGYQWLTINNTTGGAGSIAITGHPAGTGANDTIITVHFYEGFVNGSVQVQSFNNCGTSLFRSLTISTRKVETPLMISGNTTPCVGSTEVYSCPLVGNTFSYRWKVPANATIISGQGTNQITVLFPATEILFKSGNISVIALSPCGNSNPKSMAISKCVALLTHFELKQTDTKLEAISVYPNPIKGNFILEMNHHPETEVVNISIIDEVGHLIYLKSLNSMKGHIKIPISTKLSKGIFFIHIETKNQTYTKRIISEGF